MDAQTTVWAPFGGIDVEIPDSGEVRVVASRADASAYLWSDGWRTQTNFVRDTGWFWVDAMVDGELVRDSVHFHPGPTCIWIPNSLTPNSEIYDCIPLQSLCALDTMHFRVFDRWGRLVYASSNQADCWNGMDDDGHLLQDGVYVYVLEWAIQEGILRRRMGQITILR